MSVIPFNPPTRIRIVEGSKLTPPLGAYKTETRHLNLEWSIERLDALRICFRTSGLSVERIADRYFSTPAEIERLAREMGETIRVRQPQN